VQAGKDAAQLFALFIAPGFVDERLDPSRAGRRAAVSMAASDTRKRRQWQLNRGTRSGAPIRREQPAAKKARNQIHRARVLEVRIHFPPAASPLRT